MEQERETGNELREIAEALRAIEARARKARQSTLAYLIDLAAIEAEGRVRAVDVDDG